MPNTPSAIKRLKQSQKRRLHNRIAKKVIKTYTKRTLAALADGDMAKATAAIHAGEQRPKPPRIPKGEVSPPDA